MDDKYIYNGPGSITSICKDMGTPRYTKGATIGKTPMNNYEKHIEIMRKESSMKKKEKTQP